MRYKRYSVMTTAEAEDIVAAAVMELGVTGVEFEDNDFPTEGWADDGSFVDPSSLEMPDVAEGCARVIFYRQEGDEEQEEDFLRSLKDRLEELSGYADIGEGAVEVTVVEDGEYLDKWKDYFHSFGITFEDGRRLGIVPTWDGMDAIEDYDWVIRIDPGRVFGTGAHESTKIAIRGIEKYLESGMRVLDVGAGSGILSMAALKMGAGEAVGIDLEEDSGEVIRENMDINGLGSCPFRFIHGNVLEDESMKESMEEGGSYDMVAANILPEILAPLSKKVMEVLKEDGVYITSGIISDRAGDFKSSLKADGFIVIEELIEGDWRGYVCKKGSVR